MRKAIKLLRLLRPAALAFAKFRCPLCNAAVLIRLQRSEQGVRCVSCRGGPVQMSLAMAVRKKVPDIQRKTVLELSSRGAFSDFLQREARSLVGCEYFDDTLPGDYKNGVQCQDVERLSYEDETFDFCTSSDVFEHVVNDTAGFSELYRVLKPGGLSLFTVPLSSAAKTLERAKYVDDQLVHLETPEYHDDVLRGPGKVLAFRTYGLDIVDRLKGAGFQDTGICRAPEGAFMGYGRPVIYAQKSGASLL